MLRCRISHAVIVADTYDAFFSYSHHGDRIIAQVLQRELEKFGKPWYRLRRLRIFRDDTSLSANPDLWATIEAALGRSRHLVLFASPAAARSAWVDREVEWWLQHRRDTPVLFVLTRGQIEGGHGAEQQSLPPRAAASLTGEPFWVDLRSLAGMTSITPDHSDLRRAVENLAGPLAGVDKDDIVGDHVREHRRVRLLTRGAIAALSLLTIASVVGGITAVVQADRAVAQARRAESRSMALQAVGELPVRLDTAAVLAAQAFRLDDNAESRSALLRAATSTPQLVVNRYVDEEISTVAASADGRTVIAGEQDGRLATFSGTGDPGPQVAVSRGPVTGVAASGDGRLMVAADGTNAVVWPVDGAPRVISGDRSRSVAVSPSGADVAILHQTVDEYQTTYVTVHRTTDGVELRRYPAQLADYVFFEGENGILTVSAASEMERGTLADDHLTPFQTLPLTPAGGFLSAVSADGAWFGYTKYGDVSVFATRATYRNDIPGIDILPAATAVEQLPGRRPDSAVIGPSGRRAVVGDSGTLYIAAMAPPQPGAPSTPASPRSVTALPGGGPTGGGSASFLGDDDHLVSSSGDKLTWWDLSRTSRLGDGVAGVEPGDTAGTPASVAVSPADGRVAVASPGGDQAFVYGSGAPPRRIPRTSTVFNQIFPVWAPSGDVLYLLGQQAAPGEVWRVGSGGEPRSLRSLPPSSDAAILDARATPDGSVVVAVDDHGVITRTSTDTGATLSRTPALADRLATSTAKVVGTACVSPDARAVALVNQGSVEVHDTLTGAVRRVDTAGADAVYCAGDELVVSATGRLERWNAAGTARLATLPSDNRYERALAISWSERVLARLRADGVVELADLDTGAVIGELPLPEPTEATTVDPWSASRLAVGPSGTTLNVATPGGAAAAFSLRDDDWLRSACAAAGRTLSDADRFAFHLDTEVGASVC